MEKGLLPHARSEAERTLDEERRLFYVAITRAQETLTLTYCLARKKYGQLSPAYPSPFLLNIPPHLVEDVDAQSKKPATAEVGKKFFSVLRDVVG
jgi:superfamily I DNA/RNA helicase